MAADGVIDSCVTGSKRSNRHDIPLKILLWTLFVWGGGGRGGSVPGS